MLKLLYLLIVSKVTCDSYLNSGRRNAQTVAVSDTITCGTYTCPKANAKCVGIYLEACECKEEYSSYPFDTTQMCYYQKKKQLTAFLLEFFITFGAGHIYSENYALGIIKAIFFLFTCSLVVVVRYMSKKTEENNTYILIVALIGCLSCIGILVWQIIDVILIGLNRYTDGNGVDLYPMTSYN